MAFVRSGNHEKCDKHEKWMRVKYRGGLWYKKESMHSLFLAIEEEARQCLMVLST